MPPAVTVIDGTGRPHDIAEADLEFTLRSNPSWRVQSEAEGISRATGEAEADVYSGVGNALDAYGARAWSAATLGGTDAALGLLGGDQAKRHLRKLQEHQALASGVGEVVGGVTAAATGFGPVGAAAKLGARVAQAGEGAGVVARVGRAAAGAAIEGGAQGFGTGVSELALSEEPLDVERAVSTLSSRAMYGAAIGAAAGTVAKGAEIGLSKARTALAEAATRNTATANVAGDLAQLDAKGLAAAEKLEREAIEATRVTQRGELAEEITAFRRELKASKQAITTKDIKLPAAGEKLGTAELGRIAMKANKQLDNILDNPAGLAKNPAKALDALQRQENALAKLVERSDDLRAVYAADTSGARAAALDTVAPALERNRALQAKIADLTSDAASPRLAEIATAREALAASGGARPRSLAEQMAGGSVYGMVAGAVASLPIPGMGLLAPMLGARASEMVGSKVFGRLGKAMGEGQARSAAAVGKLFAVGERAARAAPPVATRVLAGVAFAPSSGAPPAGKRSLPEVYKARTTELREQITTGPTGAPMVRPQARARIAASLAPIAAFQPLLADRMETLAVRRLEFLASKMPRRPEIGAMQIGPDRWQPSDMQMRTFARYVAAAEDPDGVVERVAQGAITPEDAEVMREIYPEQLADLTRQILEQLPTLSRSLPYNRRLALSVLTGVAVDPSLEPRILAVLQSQFEAEQEPPKASPQFGSVSTQTEIGTQSERREKGT